MRNPWGLSSRKREWPKDGLAAVMVVPVRGGEGEKPLEAPDGDALWAVAAVFVPG